MDDIKKLQVKLIFGLDPGATEQTKAGLKKIAAEMEATRKKAAETRESMEKLAQIGSQMAIAGAAITGPLLLSRMLELMVCLFRNSRGLAVMFCDYILQYIPHLPARRICRIRN